MRDVVPDARLVRARVTLEAVETLADTRPVEALALCDTVIADLAASASTAAPKRTAEALFHAATILIDLGRIADGLGAVREMAARFGDGPLPLRRRVAHALWFTVLSLRSDETEAALALCAEARARYARETDPCVLDRLLSLFVEEGLILERLGRADDGRALGGALVARFQNVADPRTRDRAGRVAIRMQATFK